MLRQPTIKPTQEEEEGGDAGDDDEDDDEGSDAEPLASGGAADEDDDSEPETPRRAGNKGKGVGSPTSAGGLLQGVMGKNRGKGRAMSTSKSPLAISTVREEDGRSGPGSRRFAADHCLQIRQERPNVQPRRLAQLGQLRPRLRSSRRASPSGLCLLLRFDLKAHGPSSGPNHPFRPPWPARTAQQMRIRRRRRRLLRRRWTTSAHSLLRPTILQPTRPCDRLRPLP